MFTMVAIVVGVGEGGARAITLNECGAYAGGALRSGLHFSLAALVHETTLALGARAPHYTHHSTRVGTRTPRRYARLDDC